MFCHLSINREREVVTKNELVRPQDLFMRGYANLFQCGFLKYTSAMCRFYDATEREGVLVVTHKGVEAFTLPFRVNTLLATNGVAVVFVLCDNLPKYVDINFGVGYGISLA